MLDHSVESVLLICIKDFKPVNVVIFGLQIQGLVFFLPCKQFSLLAEAISQERQELKAREKSQAQVIINKIEIIYLHF